MATPGASFSAALVVEDFPWVRLRLIRFGDDLSFNGGAHDVFWTGFPFSVVAAQVESEDEMGMAPDKYREVFDLAQRGASAFRERRYDEVIR